jgi:ADP-ribose pyrophosphatase YjhB (NUDIX family)
MLLVTESDDKENWKLPGGSLESGEDPITGIKRELLRGARHRAENLWPLYLSLSISKLMTAYSTATSL